MSAQMAAAGRRNTATVTVTVTETLRNRARPEPRPGPTVVAIGNFDGVHRGHARLLSTIVERAQKTAAQSLVLTFDPHPAKVLAPAYAPPLIVSLDRRLELIAAAGVDATLVQPFDLPFAALSPEAFVTELLVPIGTRAVCVGQDFTFGQRRSGDIHTLQALGDKHGFELLVVPPVTVDGMVCSSSKVREFLLAGRLDGAHAILGRAPELEGRVVRGEQRGRTLGFPTANVVPEAELMPHGGIYAGWAERLDGPGVGTRYRAAISIGSNPTFGAGREVSVEAYLLDADVDLYDQRLRLELVERLRGEERFSTVESLVAQIERDVARTRQVISVPPSKSEQQ